ESEATKASSGSTPAGFEYGAGTTDGEAEAVTVTPPSKLHVCSRENWPLKKSAPVRFHLMIALCSDTSSPPFRPRGVSSLNRIRFPKGSVTSMTRAFHVAVV